MIFKNYVIYLFLSLNITISYFILGNDTNGLLVCMIGISPLMYLVSGKKMDSADILFIFLLLLMFLCGYSKPGFRIISYLYGLCYVFSFLCLLNAFYKGMFTTEKMHRILRGLLYAYAIVLFIQQVCIVIGIQPINQYFGFVENKWKLPALAQEPSHMAIFVFFFMYCYMLISEKLTGHRYSLKDAKNERWVWFAYLWCMLTCQSTSAIIYFGLLFLRYIKPRTIVKSALAGLVAAVPLYFLLRESEAFQRAILFSEAFSTFDIEMIDTADHSAAYRVFPLFYLLQNFNIFDPDFWFGHGLDYGKNTLNLFALDISGDGTYDGNVNMGGFFGYILDYGFLCFTILCFAVKKVIKGVKEPWLLFFYIWINMFIGFNMQLFWSSTVLMAYMANCNKIVNN